MAKDNGSDIWQRYNDIIRSTYRFSESKNTDALALVYEL